MSPLPSLLLAALVIPAPQAVSPGELTPFLKVISTSAGAQGRIACKDLDLSLQLKKNGLSPDAKAPVAWAANEEQLRGYLAEGKLVVAGDAGLLAAGAGIAIVRENGKPVIRVHARNLAASGVVLTDAVLKISRIIL